MFFDCSALLLGLAASLVAKWKPSDKFTYGFGRAEILAGLANGLFLLFIALFIMKEAIERTFEPPEVHHERLFVISVLGFLVNLIGIFVFQHGGQAHHHHGGSGCSHSHAVSKKATHHSHHHDKKSQNMEYTYDNLHGYTHYASPTVITGTDNPGTLQGDSVALDMNGYSNNNSNSVPSMHHENHNHGHHHSHDHNLTHTFEPDKDPLFSSPASSKSHSHGGAHRGQIMQSVFLHIVADTLGSIGVMVSALLMNQFGWMIADPLCSLFIAILISVSVYPLLRDSMYILMQRVPVELDKKLPECLSQIQHLHGVLNVYETHFWTMNSDTYIGSLKLEVRPQADYKQVMDQSKQLLYSIGVTKVHIQIDYAI